MNHGSGVTYGSTECEILIRLNIVRKSTGPGSSPNEIELSLLFNDKTGKNCYCGTLPGQNALTAASQLAGIDPPIKFVRNPTLTQQLICYCIDSVDEIQLGTFIMYLARYTHQSRLT